MTNNQSNTQAHKKQAKRDERKRGKEKAKVLENFFRSGGEENERREANAREKSLWWVHGMA